MSEKKKIKDRIHLIMKNALLPRETEKTKSQNVRGPQKILWENSFILDTVHFTPYENYHCIIIRYSSSFFRSGTYGSTFHYPDCDLLQDSVRCC